jgi:hypothetical protein
MADETRGRPIFILGPPRSGTTLLSVMLQAHPRIAIPPENRFVLPTYFNRASFGDLSQLENRRQLAEAITSSDAFGNLGLDPGWVVDRITAAGWTVGAAFGQVLRAHADRFGKVRWGDKRPAYRRYLWVIERLFPNAQFVNTIRDGRDCVASMASLPYWQQRSEPSYRIREWMEAVEYAEAARERLSPESFHDVRYEQLVTDPEKELRGLCDFLGEEFDEAMLAPRTVADQVVPDNQVWHAKTRGDVSAGSIGGFADRLTERELQACETIMGDRLREFDYELSGASHASNEQLEAYARFTAQREGATRKQKKEDMSLSYPWPVADMAASESQLHRRVADLEERTAKLTGQRDRVRARLDRVLGSRTWRWTEPLRAARRRATGQR